MMRARWIRLAGACRALASLRRMRSSAGSLGGRAYSGGLAMWSPSSARRRHDEHEADRPTLPRLRNAAPRQGSGDGTSPAWRASSSPWPSTTLSASPPHRQGPPTGGPVGTRSGLDGQYHPCPDLPEGGWHAGAGSWRARAPSALSAVWLERDQERPWRHRGGASSQADHPPLSPMQPPSRPAGGSPEGGDRAAATGRGARPTPSGATPASRRTAPGAGQASALAG